MILGENRRFLKGHDPCGLTGNQGETGPDTNRIMGETC